MLVSATTHFIQCHVSNSDNKLCVFVFDSSLIVDHFWIFPIRMLSLRIKFYTLLKTFTLILKKYHIIKFWKANKVDRTYSNQTFVKFPNFQKSFKISERKLAFRVIFVVSISTHHCCSEQLVQCSCSYFDCVR